MSLAADFREARRDEDRARLRRVFALRAMRASGMTQRQIAEAVGITQPAVSQQLKFAPDLDDVPPDALLEAAAPVINRMAAERGYTRLAVFGSVARGDAHRGSDIDLVVEAPDGTSTFDFIRFKRLVEQVLGREVDLVSYRGLNPRMDDDIVREAVPL